MISVVPAIKGFTITFDPSKELDIAGYVVHASLINNFTPTAGNLVNKGPDTVVTCQVPFTGTVYVKIAAYDSFEDLDNINFAGLNYSTQFTVYVGSNNPLDTVAPSVPTGITVTTFADTSGQADTCYANVTWVAVADTDLDLSGYIVQLRKGTDAFYSQFTTTTTSYKISNLIPSTTYTIRVASYDKWGNVSAFSSWVDATTGKDTTAPDPPTTVACSGGFDTITVTIAGATNTDFHHYEIQVSMSSNYAAPNTVTTSASITSLSVGEGYTYWVRVRAVDRSGNTSAWVNAPSSVSTALVLPNALYNELRTDFLINNVLFKFGRTGDTSYPVETSLYVVSTSGNVVWKNKSYTVTNGVTTLTSATGKYVKATCDGTTNTATLSLISTTTDLTTLATNELILAVTSTTKQPDTNGNYVCYVRNGNSLEIEGALIRSATIDTAKIKSLDIGNAVVSGTLNAARIGAGSITADKVATGVTGNLCLGLTVTGTNGASNVPTDGLKTVGSPYYTFCNNAGTQVNNAPEVSYFEVDLGVVRNIGQVNLYFYSGDARTHLYKLKYSTDGGSWSYMAGTSLNTGWASSTPSIPGMTINPTIVQPSNICQARFIRVYGNGSTANTYNHIYEIEAFEYGTLVSGDQLSTGRISTQTSIAVGDSKVLIDGTTSSIKVSDGTINRVTLGNLGSSYGIDIKNSSGSSIFTSSGNIDGARVSNLYVTGEQITSGIIKSSNYVAGTSGWSINTSGSAEFNTANIIDTLQIKGGAVTVPWVGNLTGLAFTGLSTVERVVLSNVVIDSKLAGKPLLLSFMGVATTNAYGGISPTMSMYLEYEADPLAGRGIDDTLPTIWCAPLYNSYACSGGYYFQASGSGVKLNGLSAGTYTFYLVMAFSNNTVGPVSTSGYTSGFLSITGAKR